MTEFVATAVKHRDLELAFDLIARLNPDSARMVETLAEADVYGDSSTFLPEPERDDSGAYRKLLPEAFHRLWSASRRLFANHILDDPLAYGLSEDRVAAKGISDPWCRLATAWHLSNEPLKLSQLLNKHPEAVAWEGDFCAAKVDWEAAILAYSLVVTSETEDDSRCAPRRTDA